MKTTSSIQSHLKALMLVCLLGFLKTNVNATHITGGELSYQCLGSNTYKLTLKVYRDCILGQALFDDPAKITVWSGAAAYLQVEELPFQGAVTIPYISADTNWVPQGYTCVEVATYIDTVFLLASNSGYYFAYQRCCRTGDIIDLIDPLNTGSTYWEKVPSLELCNNSPEFNNHPPLALCVNRPMTFDHSATDLDGDSLVYYLCSAFDGATPADPQPYVTSAPPFSLINFSAPYSASFPLPGFPALSIDSITGIITVTPYAMGNYLVGVGCREYRDGILLGDHHSDFRYSVVLCPYGIGIENYTEADNHKIFPNPTESIISFENDEIFIITVFDIYGKLVYTSLTPKDVFQLNVHDWKTGVYYYTLRTDNRVYKGKFIKQ